MNRPFRQDLRSDIFDVLFTKQPVIRLVNVRFDIDIGIFQGLADYCVADLVNSVKQPLTGKEVHKILGTIPQAIIIYIINVHLGSSDVPITGHPITFRIFMSGTDLCVIKYHYAVTGFSGNLRTGRQICSSQYHIGATNIPLSGIVFIFIPGIDDDFAIIAIGCNRPRNYGIPVDFDFSVITHCSQSAASINIFSLQDDISTFIRIQTLGSDYARLANQMTSDFSGIAGLHQDIAISSGNSRFIDNIITTTLSKITIIFMGASYLNVDFVIILQRYFFACRHGNLPSRDCILVNLPIISFNKSIDATDHLMGQKRNYSIISSVNICQISNYCTFITILLYKGIITIFKIIIFNIQGTSHETADIHTSTFAKSNTIGIHKENRTIIVSCNSTIDFRCFITNYTIQHHVFL